MGSDELFQDHPLSLQDHPLPRASGATHWVADGQTRNIRNRRTNRTMRRTATQAKTGKKSSAGPPLTKTLDPKKPAARAAGEVGRTWTFLTNHAHVLIVLDGQPGLVLREVADRVGITERAVQRIVQDLEEEGFVRREKIGRKNHYEVLRDKALRHPIESHRQIGDLLNLITG